MSFGGKNRFALSLCGHFSPGFAVVYSQALMLEGISTGPRRGPAYSNWAQCESVKWCRSHFFSSPVFIVRCQSQLRTSKSNPQAMPLLGQRLSTARWRWRHSALRRDGGHLVKRRNIKGAIPEITTVAAVNSKRNCTISILILSRFEALP